MRLRHSHRSFLSPSPLYPQDERSPDSAEKQITSTWLVVRWYKYKVSKHLICRSGSYVAMAWNMELEVP